MPCNINHVSGGRQEKVGQRESGRQYVFSQGREYDGQLIIKGERQDIRSRMAS